MLQGPIVDVAIGLIFFYVLLSLVCSAVQELLAALFGFRASTLRKGVLNLVGDYTDKIYEHPLITSLSRPRRRSWAARPQTSSDAQADSTGTRIGGSKPRPPSYIRVETLAATLLEVIASEANGEEKKRASELPANDLRSTIEKIDERVPAREFLLRLLDEGKSDVTELEKCLAAWFDESMERVSGWYKRKVQYILFGVAAVVTLAVNADTLQMAERLWTDEALRNAVVAEALAKEDARLGRGGSEGGVQDSDEPRDAGLAADLADARARVLATFPLGYSDETWVRRILQRDSDVTADEVPAAEGEGADDWLGDAFRSLVGWGLTTAAVSLGAPFWFDVLGRVARLRGSGRTETSRDNAT